MNGARVKRVILGFLCLLVWQWGAGALAETSRDARKALALRYYRGVVYFEAKRYHDALREFQEVADLEPRYKKTQRYVEHIIQILDRGRLQLKEAQGEKKRGSFSDNVDLYFLAKTYYERGDYRRALEAFEVLKAKDPDDRFSRYYVQRCREALGLSVKDGRRYVVGQKKLAVTIDDLQNEVAYVKEQMRDQERMEYILETKAQRRAAREELIRQKEMELRQQEALLEEERQDYLAHLEISKRAKKIEQEAAKWRSKTEDLAARQAGVTAELTEYPFFLDKAEKYYVAMKEALRESRWNSAGLSAIYSSIYYGDAVLIYFHGIKSAFPRHENVARLLEKNVGRSDIGVNISRLRSILKLKKIIEEEDRPVKRKEAIFLSENTEKLVEWCRTFLP